MTTKYYYIGDNQQTRGPVDASDIQALGEQMKARGETLSYCKEGSLRWTAYEETFIEEIRLSAGRQMEEDPKEFLQRVRRQTCYATLRALLNLVMVLAIVLIVIWAFIALAIGTSGGFRGLGGFGALSMIVALAWATVAIVTAIISRCLLTMLIDMADTLIEQNRRKT